MNNCQHICISAYGAVTPIGTTLDEISEALSSGKSGIKHIKKFSVEKFGTKWAGIPDLGNQPIDHQEANKGSTHDALYATQAAKSLRDNSDLLRHYDTSRIGCIIGADRPAFDIDLFAEFAEKSTPAVWSDRKTQIKEFINSFRVPHLLGIDYFATLKNIHDIIPFSGYSRCHTGLCSASLQALGMARQAILEGKIDAAIVGGVSAKVEAGNIALLEALGAVSTDPLLTGDKRSRPFDSRRSGFMPSEGAVLFVVEKEDAVRARGGNNYCRLMGYGASLSAQHVVAPHKEHLEMRLCMERALKDSRMPLSDISYINAHGTSTKLNDYHEAQALIQIFGENNVPQVTSTKSMHGHLIAAAGAMEVLGVIASFRDDFIPGTINLEKQDSAIHIPVVSKTRSTPVFNVVKNSFGMGGLAASMVLQNPKL